MIDLHCHILPGIDDGPAIIEQTMAMCRVAVEDGIKTMVATPHFKPGKFDPPTREEVFSAAALVNRRIRELGLDLKVLVGAEVRAAEDVWSYIEEFDYLSLNCTGKYALIEFPLGVLPDYWDEVIYGLIEKGVRPVIAHPERNDGFMDNPDLLIPVVRRGAVLQLTAESVTGERGPELADLSGYLLKNSLVKVIATDSHSAERRRPVLSKAVREASFVVGKQEATRMVTLYPELIINGEPV